MSKQYLLGLDIGSSSVKASLVDYFRKIRNCDFTLPSSRHPSQMPMYRAFEAREGE